MKDCGTGNLLVASSMVDAPMIARGVCLVVHQDEDNVIGVMLNRPIKANDQVLQSLMGQATTSPRNRLDDAIEDDSSDAAPPDDGQLIPGAPLHGLPKSMAQSLHFGGPMSGPVVAVHGSSDHAEAETGDGIYMAAQKDNLQNLISQNHQPYRLILGHLGWKVDRLQQEIDEGWWHMVPATADAVFAEDDQMWRGLIHRATGRSLANWIDTPDHFGANYLN